MEIFRALGALIEAPSPSLHQIAEALELGPLPPEEDHAEVFLFQLFPYASIYLGAEGMLGGEARDRVAGFWRALGSEPPAEPDHLAALLALYGELGEREKTADAPDSRERWRHARRALLFEHLVSWTPVFLAKLASSAPSFYRRWAELGQRALLAEAKELGPCEVLPLHLRAAPRLEDPRPEGGAELIRSLLSPVRTGVILTRDDLARLARDLGLAHRAGERRYVLEALLGQDAPETLSWIAEECGGAVEARALPADVPAPIAKFWRGRAAESHQLLASLALDARHATSPG